MTALSGGLAPRVVVQRSSYTIWRRCAGFRRRSSTRGTAGVSGRLHKPALDEIEPGGARRREMQIEARMVDQPALDRPGLVDVTIKAGVWYSGLGRKVPWSSVRALCGVTRRRTSVSRPSAFMGVPSTDSLRRERATPRRARSPRGAVVDRYNLDSLFGGDAIQCSSNVGCSVSINRYQCVRRARRLAVCPSGQRNGHTGLWSFRSLFQEQSLCSRLGAGGPSTQGIAVRYS
jgi:hypothetical protein